MRRTLNCVICGKKATNHTGHVHLDGIRTKKITSGLCDEHINHDKLITKYGCNAGCDGDYQEWMGDSLKETQEEMWTIVDRQSLQDSKDQFILKRRN